MKLDRQAIERWLGILGWKHCELAAKVGVTPETLSRWLTAQMPTVEHFLALTAVLNEGLAGEGLSVDLTIEDLVLDRAE